MPMPLAMMRHLKTSSLMKTKLFLMMMILLNYVTK
jgi:hypothetical protein